MASRVDTKIMTPGLLPCKSQAGSWRGGYLRAILRAVVCFWILLSFGTEKYFVPENQTRGHMEIGWVG